MEFGHILEHALFDTLNILPLLFLVYLLVEYLEHKNNTLVHRIFTKSKRMGPLLGAAFGTVPQCGFSVIAAELFSKNAISMGTLVSIFVATSDEAIPLMLAHPDRAFDLLKLILIKFVIAMVSGFLIDLIVRKKTADTCCSGHHHVHGNCESCDGGILKSAIVHSAKIFLYIFAVNILLTAASEVISPFMQFVSQNRVLQAMTASLFGIIPNCAASVVLTELYIAGKLTLSALIGGLCAGAGVGLVVLFKQNRNMKQNLVILGLIYAIGVICGIGLEYII